MLEVVYVCIFGDLVVVSKDDWMLVVKVYYKDGKSFWVFNFIIWVLEVFEVFILGYFDFFLYEVDFVIDCYSCVVCLMGIVFWGKF